MAQTFMAQFCIKKPFNVDAGATAQIEDETTVSGGGGGGICLFEWCTDFRSK